MKLRKKKSWSLSKRTCNLPYSFSSPENFNYFTSISENYNRRISTEALGLRKFKLKYLKMSSAMLYKYSMEATTKGIGSKKEKEKKWVWRSFLFTWPSSHFAVMLSKGQLCT